MSNGKKHYRINYKRLMASLLIVALLLVGITFGIKALYNKMQGGGAEMPLEPSTQEQSALEEASEEPAYPEPVTVSVYCIGDLMAHKQQLDAAYDSATQSYSFTEPFEYVKRYTQQADLCLGNVETTFKGEGPYAGYPNFNTPDSYAEAIVNTLGVDVACFANNHMLDGGMSNLKRGLQMFRDMGVETAGFRLDGEKRYTITEVKGIKIGILNYSYETPQNGGRRTLQAGILGDEALKLINHFGYEDIDGDLAGIKSEMDACRADGAQVIVCYMHWGEEYQRSGNIHQRKIAKYLAENGADIIFGSHPHVLQEIEWYETAQADGSVKRVPVYYSLGNFISNQRQETLDNRYTEQGMVAQVEFTWNFEADGIESITCGCMPTWVDRYKDASGSYHYSLIPLDSAGTFEANPTLGASGHTDRARQAYNDVTELIGKDFVR